MILPTVRIKHPAHPAGVVINEADFREDEHELHGTPDIPGGTKKLSVGELRAALTEKGIDIPEGAKKPELQALLDASAE